MNKLGDYFSFRNGKALPNKEENGQYPIFGSNGIIGFSHKYNARERTIIVGRVGSFCGSIHYSHSKCWVTDNAIIATCNIEEESEFWYFYLKTVNLNSMRTGSGQPLLNQSILKSVIISVPENSNIRINIGKRLSKFDHKINLNNQTNQTLEAIAQALYKSWFIDFEPVKAKQQTLAVGGSAAEAERAAMRAISGKDDAALDALQLNDPAAYQQLQQTAALFPAALQDSEPGEIPEGWEVKFLKDICHIKYGKNLPVSNLKENGFPVFGGNGVIGFYDEYLYEEPQTLISCRGAASGKVMYSLPKSFVTNNSLVIEHKNSGLSYFYIYESLLIQDLLGLISGSAQPQLTIANLNSVKTICPTLMIHSCYAHIASNIYKMIYQNKIESSILSQIRDKLLPRLLSGEIEL